ncbi:hypothetical protein L211DRAFT_846168 [Terfezia boudieri ATCC MYA-4762]|uniref:Extracellular membrane protein CFEM domain-containing protein n=1 Tax=Terfezia boudieri ATCC MYA-4762 TaxID=1051890 RepID=A0A3N4LWS0_9PEZI|nr:hypothetical protein L211DRAFT_846168 [Terfezia boudieri ATCC MYA-4762]
MAKATLLTAILFTTSFPILASADILQFGPGALPGCAYQCRPLWSAQYDCPGETVAGECFCRSKYLGILNQSGGGSLCESDCPETSGGAEIRAWYDNVCASFIKTSPNTPTTTPTIIDLTSNNGNQDEHNKAVEWWKNNWYWFLLAFLFITIPIGAYALWFPCRKWARRQIIQRRSRPSLPPVDPEDNPYANGGLVSPGIPPIPPGVFTNETWGDPFSPSLTRDGVGYSPHYVVPPTPSVVGSNRQSQAPAGPITTRQESWERRVREEYEGKKTIGERLTFWKKGKRREREGGEEATKVDLSGGPSVR